MKYDSARLMILNHSLQMVTYWYNEKERIHEFTSYPSGNAMTTVTLRGYEPFEFYRRREKEWELQDSYLKAGEEVDYATIRKQIWELE